MRLAIIADANALSRQAAADVAAALRGAVAARGMAVVAFSGGRTPSGMLAALAGHALPCERNPAGRVAWQHAVVFTDVAPTATPDSLQLPPDEEDPP